MTSLPTMTTTSQDALGQKRPSLRVNTQSGPGIPFWGSDAKVDPEYLFGVQMQNWLNGLVKIGKMREIWKTRIEDRDEFTRIGYRYKKIQADDERHIYVYEMTDEDGSVVGYEVVEGVKKRQPDGTPV